MGGARVVYAFVTTRGEGAADEAALWLPLEIKLQARTAAILATLDKIKYATRNPHQPVRG